MPTKEKMEKEAVEATRRWLVQFVIGLNLCPFARRPFERGLVRIAYADQETGQGLMEVFSKEVELLQSKEPSELETTLLVMPGLHDAHKFAAFHEVCNLLLLEKKLHGVFDLLPFHPLLAHAGTHPHSPENFVSRSPYPTLHLLRSASVDAAGRAYKGTDVQLLNSQKLRGLGWERLEAMLKGILEGD